VYLNEIMGYIIKRDCSSGHARAIP